MQGSGRQALLGLGLAAYFDDGRHRGRVHVGRRNCVEVCQSGFVYQRPAKTSRAIPVSGRKTGRMIQAKKRWLSAP
jgi:hypothetical protein